MSSIVIRSDVENLYESEVDYETNLHDELETFLLEENENDWDSGSADLNMIAWCEDIEPFPSADDCNTQSTDFINAVQTNDQLECFEIEDESKLLQEIVASNNVRTETYYNALKHINNKNNSECGFKRPVKVYDLDVHLNIQLLSRLPHRDILVLSAEEEEVINNCKEPKLKRLLVLNRLKRLQLEKVYTECYKSFQGCCEAIKKESLRLHDKIQFLKINKELNSMSKTYTWRLASPYFKTIGFFGVRPNADAARKINSRECLSHPNSSEGRKWSPEDQIALHSAVVANYFSYRERELEKKLKQLKLEVLIDSSDKELTEEYKFFEEQLNTLRKEGANEVPPLNFNEGLDWHCIAVHDLKGKHLFWECKAFWMIYLHPSINKRDWTVEENERIKDLAHKYDYQNWDLIAAELNTNRSGYLVAVHFNTKLCDKFRRERFLPEEDEFLLEVVKNCRVGNYIPWGRVAGYFNDRSKHQVYHRYRYYLEVKDIKKGTFTEAEDILLAHLAKVLGNDFSRISKLIPHRTSIQLRNRYSNYLGNMTINLGNYTYEDDERILNYVSAFGAQNWRGLAQQLKRTRAHVRQRYLTLKKWLNNNPDCNVEQVPRRRRDSLSHSQNIRHERMIEVLKQLRNFKGIPTLNTIHIYLRRFDRKINEDQKKWRVVKTSLRKQSMSDKKLLDFFRGTCRFQRRTNTIQANSQVESAERVAKCLSVMGYNGGLIKQNTFHNNPKLFGKEIDTLPWLNKVLAKNCRIKKELFENPQATMPLQPEIEESLDPLSLNMPKIQVKNLIPPTSTTLLGIRGMIIKLQQFKEVNKFLVAPIKLNSTRPLPPAEVDWKLEHSLLQFDVYTQTKIRLEREAFFRRFYALYKWACLLSKNFPQQLKVYEESEEEESIEEQLEPRKMGRPIKRAYDKVLKMVEARKKQRVEDFNVPETETTDIQNQVPRAKRLKIAHAIGYLPRRSHLKTHKNDRPQIIWVDRQAEDSNLNEPSVDYPIVVDSSHVEVVLDDSVSANAETESLRRVLKVSDLQLPTGIPLVDKSKMDSLMKNSNKIVILQNCPASKCTQNSEPQQQTASGNTTTSQPASDVCEAEAQTNKQSAKPRRKLKKPNQKLPPKIIRRNRDKSRQLSVCDGLNKQPAPNVFSINRNILNKSCRKWKSSAAKKSGKQVLNMILRDLSLMESQSGGEQNLNSAPNSSFNEKTQNLDAIISETPLSSLVETTTKNPGEVKHEVMFEEIFMKVDDIGTDSYNKYEDKLYLQEMLQTAAAVEARQVEVLAVETRQVQKNDGDSLIKTGESIDWDTIEKKTKKYFEEKVKLPRHLSSTEALDFPVSDFRSGFCNKEEHRKYLQEALRTAAAVEARQPVVSQENVKSRTNSVTEVRKLPSRKTKLMKSYKQFK